MGSRVGSTIVDKQKAGYLDSWWARIILPSDVEESGRWLWPRRVMRSEYEDNIWWEQRACDNLSLKIFLGGILFKIRLIYHETILYYFQSKSIFQYFFFPSSSTSSSSSSSFLFFHLVLGIEPRASLLLGKYHSRELYPQSFQDYFV